MNYTMNFLEMNKCKIRDLEVIDKKTTHFCVGLVQILCMSKSSHSLVGNEKTDNTIIPNPEPPKGSNIHGE